MKQVVDSSGAKVRGLFRADNGSLLVNDPIALAKYEQEQSRSNEIVDLKKRLEKMEQIISDLLSLNNTKN